MRVNGVSALVVHVQPYRETSSLVRLFTARYGMLAGIARGIRRARRGGNAMLQPFNQITTGWSGQGALLTLTSVELESARQLPESSLPAGFYVLELLVRLLHEHDPHPRLFEFICVLLDQFALGVSASPLLRRFEKELLLETGFGVSMDVDASGAPVEASQRYRLQADEGLIVDAAGPYAGADLLAIAADEYTDAQVRRTARLVFRALIDEHLGGRPLASRSLLPVKRS